MDHYPQEWLQVSKFRVPSVAGLVARPRVAGELHAACDQHPVVVVVAAAGAGKTTAAAQYVQARAGPAAWLTLDAWDARPGRFVTYLAAAIGGLRRTAPEQALAMLQDGLPPVECAAILAEAIPPGGLLVLDDVHHLDAGDVRPVLRAFVGNLAPGAALILLARRLPAVGLEREALTSRVGGLFDRDLAFTPQETADLLTHRGVTADAGRLHAATGGWAAGLVFDAAAAQHGRAGLTPGEDPLFAYLGSEIFAGLPEGLRHVLLASGVLDVVTPRRLEEILDDPAGPGHFDALCREHLPAQVQDGELRYHPRFREFLHHRLRTESPGAMRTFTARFGEILRREGHLEEAVDAFLEARDVARAEVLAPDAVGMLMRRGDWDRVIAWSEALGEEVLGRNGSLRRAQVRSLLMGRRQHDVERIVHGMLASGEVDRLTHDTPDAVGWAVWALHGSGEWAKLLPLLPGGPGGRVAVVRHLFRVSASPEPAPELPAGMVDHPQPFHVALQSAFYYQGRFGEVDRLAQAAGARGPVTQALGQIFRIAALRERGDLAGARAALQAVGPRVRASRYLEFWHHVEGELAFEEGHHDEGIALIREARRLSATHRYRIGAHAIFAATEGKLLTRAGRLDEAIGVLHDASGWCQERGLLSFGEWADTWLGAATLLADRDPQEARARLRRAVDGMLRAGRRLELAAGAVFLAEAEWRAGDEDAHDAACDIALGAAHAQGTFAPLRRALDIFPGVLARRIDVDDGDASPWRRLQRGASTAAPPASPHPRLLIRTFGEPGMEVDGRPVRVGLGKATEVAALISAAGERGITRRELRDRLFTGGERGQTYLRQAVHRLRRVLPDGVKLQADGDRLSWAPAAAVASEDAIVASLVHRARLDAGDGRIALLRDALAITDGGRYLPGVDDRDTEERRRHLTDLEGEARCEVARATLRDGAPAEARTVLRECLRRDALHEDAWQLLMRAEVALEGPEGVARVLRECLDAFDAAHLSPCEATLGLAERLRRTPERARLPH